MYQRQWKSHYFKHKKYAKSVNNEEGRKYLSRLEVIIIIIIQWIENETKRMIR